MKNSCPSKHCICTPAQMQNMGKPHKPHFATKKLERGVKLFLRTRDIKKQIWLNEEELKTLKQNAKKTGLNESAYIRNLIMGYKPKEQPTENMYEIINQLKLIGINLNQIARKANALNLVDAPFYKKVYVKWSKLVENIKKDFFDMEK